MSTQTTAVPNQTLYEIALSIGSSLELIPMLEACLKQLTEKLHCSLASVHLLGAGKSGSKRLLPVYSTVGLADAQEDNATYQLALNTLDSLVGEHTLEMLHTPLPYTGFDQAQDTYFHILHLAGQGILVLIKPQIPLDATTLQLLFPLLVRLAQACRACSHYNRLQKVYNEQQVHLDSLEQTQREIRQIAGRNVAILSAIPDTMIYVDENGRILDYRIASLDDETALTNVVKIGHSLTESFPKDIAQALQQAVNDAFVSREIQYFEFEHSVTAGHKVDFIANERPSPVHLEARIIACTEGEVLIILRDVTTQKYAQAQITGLAKFPDENPNPVFRIKPNGTILYRNEAAQQLVDAWSDAQRSPNQLLPQWLNPISDVLQTGSVKEIEVSLNNRVYSLVATPVIEAHYVNLYLRDITQRKQAEQAQKIAEAHLRMAIGNIPSILFTLDAEGKFILSEGRSLSKLSRSPGQVVGQSIFQVYANNPTIIEATQGALAGQPQAFEVTLADLAFEAWYQPIFDDAQHVIGVVGVAHDITERRNTEEVLRENTQQLTTILDTVGEGIITVDSRSNIIMVNQEAQRIWGYSEIELLGEPLTKLMPEKYRKAHQAGVERYAKTGEAVVLDQWLELEGQRKNGQIFPLEVHIAETKIGNQLLFTAAVRDITERHELDKMRDEFVSTVSHELRTPLASMMGFVETILSGRPGPLTDIQRRFLQNSYQSSERLLKLVEELLTVSRVQQGTLKLDKTLFSPDKALQSIKTMIQPLAETKSIVVQLQNDWPDDTQFYGDQGRIEQVITNLISNAIKFTPPNGEVKLCSTRTEAHWCFEVIDTGMGIPDDEIPNLFSRFFRATNAQREQVQGTGLGLYVCKAIVEEHQGTIEVESVVDQGTTVKVRLPT
ncbi:MAG: PAS domain S-box protein [Chloroflexota bacterium]